MSHANFNILYDGPALQGSEMAVKDLSAALLAADSLFSAADLVLNDGRTDARLKVQGSFKSGCFGIDFISAVQISEKFKDLFIGDPATAICNAGTIFGCLFGARTGLFTFLKWLKNRKVTKFEHRDGKCIIYVGSDFFESEKHVIDLYNNHKVREALEKVTDPIRGDGVDSFAVMQNDTVLVEASKSESEYFTVSSIPAEALSDITRQTWLNIVSPAFKEGDKWRVNDGGANFYTSIIDPDFLLKVLNNKVEFGAATRLMVSLREIQYTDSKGMLKKDYEVIKVKEIIKPDQQIHLDMPE